MTSREDPQSRGVLLKKKIMIHYMDLLQEKGSTLDDWNHKMNPPTED